MDDSTAQRPLLLVISGPAGSGKTTLCDGLRRLYPSIRRFITTTTRAPRPGERDGVDYHFLSRQQFEQRITEGGFYEWAQVHGNYYGTERARLLDQMRDDHDLLLNIDVQGADAFRAAARDDHFLRERLVTVFIKPADIDQLRARLSLRGCDDAAEIQRRLQTALAEIPQAERFDHVIVSGTMDADLGRLVAIYRAEKEKARTGA